MKRLLLTISTTFLLTASIAAAQSYKTPSQNSAVDQLHTSPGIVDQDENINTDPAMTSSTTTTGTPSNKADGKNPCVAGAANSNQPDNTDNPPNVAACSQ